MPAFASDGTVSCPFPAAWLEFFNADKDKWPANAYRTPDCSASREHSHGSFVAALPDGSFPPVFLWDEINYRVIAKGADGSVVATIERVTSDSEFVGTAAPEPAVEPEPQPEPAPVIDLAAENEALRRRIAELEAMEAPLLPAPDALMSDWGEVGADEDAEAALTTDDLLRADDEAVADVVAKLSRQRRKRFTELLNVELAELQQSRDGPHEDRKREAKVERLLGVFARVGEM